MGENLERAAEDRRLAPGRTSRSAKPGTDAAAFLIGQFRTIRTASCDLARMAEIEREVDHDTIAFLRATGETVGDAARFIHLGLTSSDVIDTGLAIQVRDAGQLCLPGSDALIAAVGLSRDRTQGHDHDRPNARRVCRANDVRTQNAGLVRRARPPEITADGRERADRGRQDFGRGRHARACIPRISSKRSAMRLAWESSRFRPKSFSAIATRTS